MPKGVIWRQAFIAITNISICPMKTRISDEIAYSYSSAGTASGRDILSAVSAAENVGVVATAATEVLHFFNKLKKTYKMQET